MKNVSEPDSAQDKSWLLLAKTAHEINNLAMALSADLKTLGKMLHIGAPGTESVGDVPELIGDMNLCVARVSGILRRVLEHSCLACCEHSPINLPFLVDSALKIAMNSFDDSIKVCNMVDETAPEINGDETMLCQALVNLLRNAAHAVWLHDGEKNIIVSSQLGEGFLLLSVSDTGPGLDPVVKENLFKPFVSTKKGDGGMGLGLFIARESVLSHNGELYAESEPGRGAKFTIKLPL